VINGAQLRISDAATTIRVFLAPEEPWDMSEDTSEAIKRTLTEVLDRMITDAETRQRIEAVCQSDGRAAQ
jgi:predicted deacetylase